MGKLKEKIIEKGAGLIAKGKTKKEAEQLAAKRVLEDYHASLT